MKGIASGDYFALVHQSVPREKVTHIPDAMQALDEEWKKLEDENFAFLDKPRPK